MARGAAAGHTQRSGGPRVVRWQATRGAEGGRTRCSGGHAWCSGGSRVVQWGVTRGAVGGHTWCSGGSHVVQWGSRRVQRGVTRGGACVARAWCLSVSSRTCCTNGSRDCEAMGRHKQTVPASSRGLGGECASRATSAREPGGGVDHHSGTARCPSRRNTARGVEAPMGADGPGVVLPDPPSDVRGAPGTRPSPWSARHSPCHGTARPARETDPA